MKPKLTVILPEREENKVIVRPERNIDRVPAIWAPSNGRGGAAKVKTIDFDVEVGGITKRAQLIILPGTMYVKPSRKELKSGQYSDEKKKEVRVVLTTFDQRVFLVLVKIWESEAARRDSCVYFSIRQIAQELGLEWGTETIRLVEESLYRLKTVTLDWQKSFISKNGKDVEVTSLEPTNILSELKIVKRKEDGQIVKERGFFKFHSSIENNLKATYTRPVRLDVVCSFTSHIAQLIYTLIDREMFGDSAKQFQMRSENLFRSIGLAGERYKYRSKRVEALTPALEELLGKPLSSGEVINKAELKETVDKKDYNVVFRKGVPVRIVAEPKQEIANQVSRFTDNDSRGREEAVFQQLVHHGISESCASQLIKKDFSECELWANAWPYQNKKGMENPAAVLISFIEKKRRPLPKIQKTGTTKKASEVSEDDAAWSQYLREVITPALENLSPEWSERFEKDFRDFTENTPLLRNVTSDQALQSLRLTHFEKFADWNPELSIISFKQWKGQGRATR